MTNGSWVMANGSLVGNSGFLDFGKAPKAGSLSEQAKSLVEREPISEGSNSGFRDNLTIG